MAPSDHPYRTNTRDPGGARVTTRDLILLRFVAEAQPVRAIDLGVVAGMSLEMVRRRTRILRDLGLLQTHVIASEECNYYTLGRAAPQALLRIGFPDRRIRVPSGLGKVNIKHHLGAVAFHAALIAACARVEDARLVEFLHEADVRAETGGAPGVNVPDAVAVLRVGGARLAVAIEIDLGTEKNPNQVVASKMVPYARAWTQGDPLRRSADWSVAFVCGSAWRVHRLVKAAWQAQVPVDPFFYVTAAEVNDRTILGAAFQQLVVQADSARLVAAAPFGRSAVRSAGRHADGGAHRCGGDNGLAVAEAAPEADPASTAAKSFTGGEA